MRDLTRILHDLDQGNINSDEAENRILRLLSVVVSKDALSNLDEAIKKAKPNMDKIKDVDKHLDSIK